MRVLVLNPGSATLKGTVVAPPAREPSFDRTTSWGDAHDTAAIGDAVGTVVDEAGHGVEAVGYRVVHGGDRFTEATLVDDDVIEAIEALGDLSPLHNPVAATTIRAARERLPDIPHDRPPEPARRVHAGPRSASVGTPTVVVLDSV